jgi:Carboxypeptidase regulatory-like domain
MLTQLVVVTLLCVAANVPEPTSRLTDLEAEARWRSLNHGTATVHVTDEDGSPVANAEVLFGEYVYGRVVARGRPASRGTTNREGVCSFGGLCADTYSVYARAGELGCWTSARVTPDNPSPTVEARLGILLSVSGTVCDLAGKPVGEVTVSLKGIPVTETSEDGRFTIRNLERKVWTLFARFTKDGYKPVTCKMWAGPGPVKVFMSPADSVAAKVVLRFPDGGPVAGQRVSVGDGYVVTDDQGSFMTVPLPVGEETDFGMSFTHNALTYYAPVRLTPERGDTPTVAVEVQPTRRIVTSETPLPSGEHVVTCYPITDVEGVAIHGRVAKHLTGKPVMATVVCQPGGERTGGRGNRRPREVLARTDSEGAFRFEYLPRMALHFRVMPDDPVLYHPGPRLDVIPDESGPPADGLLFKVRKGCAIRGTVVSHDGTPVARAHVGLRPQTKEYAGPVKTDEEGAFAFTNLPPAKTGYRVVLYDDSHEEGVAGVTLGPFKAGDVREDLVLKKSAQPEELVVGELEGTVVDAAGIPVAGIALILPPEFAAQGMYKSLSGDDGAFSLPYRGTGEAQLTAQVRASLVVGASLASHTADVPILEGDQVVLTGAATQAPLRVVVERLEIPMAGGVVLNEDGRLFGRVSLDCITETSHGGQNSEDGTFVVDSLGTGFPLAVEVAPKGYQAVVLLRGIHYDVGDMDLRIVMKKGPFPADRSLFESITGLKSEERTRHPLAERTWRHLADYRRLAGNEPGLWLHVTDPAGEPIQSVIVSQRLGNTVNGIPDMRTEIPEGKPHLLHDERGFYVLPASLGSSVYVWAEGRGRHLYRTEDSTWHSDLNEIVLHPASSLTVRVVDAQGEPRAGAWVKLDYSGQRIGYCGHGPIPRPPKTDKQGKVVFEDLAPGTYTLYVGEAYHSGDGLEIEVGPGQDMEREVGPEVR